MTIPRRQSAEAPLSFAQERLWFLEQLGATEGTPPTARALLLTGALDAGALERALAELLQRHESLRTSFPARAGAPVQHVLPPRAVELLRSDLSSLPEASRLPEVLQIAEQEIGRRFDLSRDLLVRSRLIRLSERQHALLLVAHPIACDESSMDLLVRELGALYGSFAEGAPSALPQPRIQYGDFASWQRGLFAGEGLEKALAFWRGRLEGAPAPLELPADRERPSLPSFRGALAPFEVAEGAALSLRQLSREQGISLGSVLLAAFALLLARSVGREEFVIGFPTSGRPEEAASLVGFFVNTLPLRADLSGDPSFRGLARRLDSALREALAHELPFARLVAELHPERDLSHNPLFQVMFSFRPMETGPWRFGSLDAEPMEMESRTANFDLTLELVDAGGLSGAFEYNLDLFEPGTVARMARHFATLLDAVGSDPDSPLSRLSLLSQQERRRVLVDWNATDAPWPREACVHQLFEQQADRTPEAIAVEFEGQTLTYRDLELSANRLANHLRRLGVGPEVFVALCVERSFDMVVALLAILKAGGAYVPLDPTYPHERLVFMLNDVRPAVLITRSRWREVLPRVAKRTVLLDSEAEAIAGESAERPAIAVDPENVACVLYTSGSTGAPKGVLLPHRAIVNHNVAVAARFRLEPRDRVLQFASINFDASLEELFPTWLAGARVVLRPEGVFPTDELMSLIETAGLTVLDLPTAWWHAWVFDLAAGRRQLPASLRLVIVGGEKASRERFATWRRIGGTDRVAWVNTYGPTETAVVATAWQAPSSGPLPEELPIGRPIANARVYLLDQSLQPVPSGVAAEIFIGGAGVARGYWNRPDLTAERFVLDAFSAEAGSRLYRTGDWGRYRSDGEIEFLGRRDDQVKIQGYRIELGEIESVLSRYPGLRQGAVLAREDTPGVRKLVAYVTPGSDGAPDLRELKRFLRAQLPEYMVPSVFVVLDSLPLTPSGKVNRRVLPAPQAHRPEPTEGYEAPRTPVEEVVAAVWGEVLGLARVGVQDNFFELGGHSLLATRVVSRLREELAMDLPLRVLFEAPTVAGVALSIVQRQAETAPPEEIERLLEELEGSGLPSSGESADAGRLPPE